MTQPSARQRFPGPRIRPAAPPEQPPPGFEGSLPEWLVYENLVSRGLEPGGDFHFQTSAFGGRQTLGGIVTDFTFTNPPGLAFSILGVYYHFVHKGGTKAMDILARESLAKQGILLIFIEDGHIIEDVQTYVTAALAGDDRSRLG